MNDWSERVRDAMRRRGMTYVQLARELGVGPSSVGRWLSGRRTPGEGILRHIGGILGIRLAGDGDADAADAEEIELLTAFRRLRPAQRLWLLETLRDREPRCHCRPEDFDG